MHPDPSPFSQSLILAAPVDTFGHPGAAPAEIELIARRAGRSQRHRPNQHATEYRGPSEPGKSLLILQILMITESCSFAQRCDAHDR